MAIFKPRVFSEIYGEMISRLTASTPLTDINHGSVLTTMLEAAAQEDDEQYFQMLEIIRAYSIDTVTSVDLDNRAFEYGITRKIAAKASTRVTIGDSAITKVMTGIYSGLPGSPSGADKVNGDTSAGFRPSGTIIIGRGTTRAETIAYSSITVQPTYVTFNLASNLQYDHGTDETIILSQGGNRYIAAGTKVQVPSSDLSPQVDYTLDVEATILDGEEEVENISVTASEAGMVANVPVGAINSFASKPFPTAKAYNPQRVTNGANPESDQELRDRIKSHVQSLSRGTIVAIINSAVGVISAQENKRVVSASLIEPTLPADVVKLYIDDGTGFIPLYRSVGFEVITEAATGGEKFLKIINVPLVKAFVETENEEPFNLTGGETLFVDVNGVVETITFAPNDFNILGAATAQEIVMKINSTADTIESRKSSGGKKVKIFSRKNSEEQLRVTGGAANASNKLKFPTDEKFTTKLFLHSNHRTKLLSKDGQTAQIEAGQTQAYDISISRNLCVIVDGKKSNPQNVWLHPTDFPAPQATSLEVVQLINTQLSGAIAERSSNNTKFQIISNTKRSSKSMLQIVEDFDAIYESGMTTYFGMYDIHFSTIHFNLSQVASASVGPKFEAWSEARQQWIEIGAVDETLGLRFSGHVIISKPSKWVKKIVDAKEMYWVRMTRQNVPSTEPVIASVKIANANSEFGFASTEIIGRNKDYTLNRFIGQIELETPLKPFEKLSLGSDETRASVTMESAAPVGLSGGESFDIEIDGQLQNVTFEASDFMYPGTATAAEIADKFAKTLKGVSITTVDDGTKVKIISNTWNNGSVKVIQSLANTFLQFRTDLVESNISHFPATESIAGPFNMSKNKNLIVVVDDNFPSNFQLPAFKKVVCGAGCTSTKLVNLELISTFPSTNEIKNYKVVMISGSQFGTTRFIQGYEPATGEITLDAPLVGAPFEGDEFEIIPVTAEHFVKFWNNRFITLISTQCSVLLSGGGNKIQFASLKSSQDASIFVTGGDANAVLQFSPVPFRGVDGYRYYTGLAQTTQWTIDGRDSDQTGYPGMRAAGIQVEVIEPVTIPIKVNVDVTTREGVTLSSISNEIRTAISAYVNNLKVGQDVILSEITVAAKGVGGVFDVKIDSPTSNVAIADSELPRINDTDITVG
jgi:uncharacterized phage protein gp47/JayE